LTDVPEQNAPDAALVLRARNGDDHAFGELVRRRQGPVRGLLRRVSGDAALGDDLAQETFLRAWRTLAQLRDPGAFGGWLRQIAVNTWLQHARKARLPMDDIEDHMHGLASPSGAGAAERLDLDAALARLRAPERLCVTLSYAEGLSHAEIAQSTGLPLGTVKSHVARGAARLRAWLRPDTVGHEESR
jgi:RNA polymerase sigma-70 factor (ECF subfamily)